MEKERGGASANPPACSTQSTVDSYIGSCLSVISNSDMRYEGVLCSLNPQELTFGLRDVRSYGTEGRRASGSQVPPNEKVYESIIFRGCDIKDIQVKRDSPMQNRDPLYDDPAIIQANSSYTADPSSFNVLPAAVESLTELNFPKESSFLSQGSFPGIVSTHEMDIWGSHAARNASSSHSMPTMWRPGFAGVQSSLSSSTALNLMQNHGSLTPAAATTMYGDRGLASEQLPLPSTVALSSNSLQPYNYSALVHSNKLAMPSSLTYPKAIINEAEVAGGVIPDPLQMLPMQSLQHSTSYLLNSVPDPLLMQRQQTLLTQSLSKISLSEQVPTENPTADRMFAVAGSSVSPISSSPANNSAASSLLPLQPPPSQKSSSEFTEEFDFEAMNAKFNKDEVREQLSKAVSGDEVGNSGVVETSNLYSQGNNLDLVTKHDDVKPAYNKDDFFDTISRNSIGRHAQPYPDSERSQSSYNERRGWRGPNRRGFNRGRAYYHGNRGRGRPPYGGYPER